MCCVANSTVSVDKYLAVEVVVSIARRGAEQFTVRKTLHNGNTLFSVGCGDLQLDF